MRLHIYLKNSSYHGPPSHEQIKSISKIWSQNGRFGPMTIDPIHVDEQIQDGDEIGSLKVIHTPGHTPEHVSLYSEKHRIVFGATFFSNQFLIQRGCLYLMR